ncbi:hypothetical protein DIRU0_D26720 [Diutina rugosa]
MVSTEVSWVVSPSGRGHGFPSPIVLGPCDVASCCIKTVMRHHPASDEERNVTSFCSVSVVVIGQQLRIPCSVSILIDLSVSSLFLSQAEIATVLGRGDGNYSADIITQSSDGLMEGSNG